MRGLSHIKGHIIRLGYSAKKVDDVIRKAELPRMNNIRSDEVFTLLKWYRSNVDYHLTKMMGHLRKIDDKIVERAKKENKSNIKVHLKG